MINIEPYNFIIYKSGGSKKIGIILESLSDKCIVLNDNERKIKIPLVKIFAVHPQKFQQSDTKALVQILKTIQDDANDLSRSIELEEIYDVVKDVEGGLSLNELAELYFTVDVLPFHLYALVFALENNTIFFKEKYQKVYPKSEKQVYQSIQQREIAVQNELKKQEVKEFALKWLQNFFIQKKIQTSLNGSAPSGMESNSKTESQLSISPKDPVSIDLPPEVSMFIEPIRRFIIDPDEPSLRQSGLNTLDELKKNAGMKFKSNPITTGFDFLNDLGIFTEDENLSLLRYNIPSHFSPETLLEADTIAQNFNPEILAASHKDLTHLFTFSIDDYNTTDIDDAISIENSEDPNLFVVYIHISDVSSIIKMNSSLDKEALERGLTVYLPDGKISMFPSQLSENITSLIQGQIRPALTFEITIDQHGHIPKKKIYTSLISVTKKLSYDSANELLFNPSQRDEDAQLLSSALSQLYPISLSLQRLRIQNGAMNLDSEEIKIQVDPNGDVHLKKIAADQPSNTIVKEFMILCNSIAAEFCMVHQIPVFYFSQLPPDEMPEFELNTPLSRQKRYEILRNFKKSEIVLSPASHFALGIKSYTQATSPIRRYHDLIIHRQIKAFLEGQTPPYSLDEIQMLAATAEKNTRSTIMAEKETNRYYILKYLRTLKGEKTEAIVLKKTKTGYLLELQNSFIQVPVVTKGKLQLGQMVYPVIENANPRLNSISVRL